MDPLRIRYRSAIDPHDGSMMVHDGGLMADVHLMSTYMYKAKLRVH